MKVLKKICHGQCSEIPAESQAYPSLTSLFYQDLKFQTSGPLQILLGILKKEFSGIGLKCWGLIYLFITKGSRLIKNANSRSADLHSHLQN